MAHATSAATTRSMATASPPCKNAKLIVSTAAVTDALACPQTVATQVTPAPPASRRESLKTLSLSDAPVALLAALGDWVIAIGNSSPPRTTARLLNRLPTTDLSSCG